MATTIVIKMRNGEIDGIIANDFDVKVIIADYDNVRSWEKGKDPHGEPCRITRDAAAEDPKEVGEFEEVLERRREAMRRGRVDEE